MARENASICGRNSSTTGKVLLQQLISEAGAEHPLVLEREGWCERDGAAGSLQIQHGAEGGAVAGAGLGNQSAGEIHGESNAFLNIVEEVPVVGPLESRDARRNFSGQPPRGMDAINTQVHEGSATGKPPVKNPRGRCLRERVTFAERGVQYLERAGAAAEDQVANKDHRGLEDFAVSGHQ